MGKLSIHERQENRKPGFIIPAFVFLGGRVRRYEIYLHLNLEKSDDNYSRTQNYYYSPKKESPGHSSWAFYPLSPLI